ncbi:SDR family NAD(P)-dependent oxidoreductase [Cyanobium sp. HWJ4-Hawea]|uniref:SDR family NAD(P)-dependent oxidoreductase n=1 Tax=Cyanobium sp. HWJ4-Hawea TaxID=2823713 RepID=UPI0020CF472E|nr:SDR family NAD(P)-dependent oxidoreductase [Cyanobium sp. HWJ4-Hawea]MCP9810147.1 SDR family NAD(P)-dependent oxidoreductase [Cyanobium sp. HWJ4-Hawea]
MGSDGNQPSLHILITGASSGIGFEAASQLLAAGHQLTLPCRDGATATGLRNRLGLRQGLESQIQTPICDLADLGSVLEFGQSLLQAGKPIDSLVLNAGLQYSGAAEPRWSAQGFELTIAVNHLAHQVLLQQLLPLLKQASKPRLVVTGSEVHDPSTPGGKVGQAAGLGDLAGLRQGPGAPMLDGISRFNAEKAYKDSKLCNLLMAQELERRQRGQIQVLAWSPGLVIPRQGGGFFRYSRSHNPLGQALFALAARDLLRVCETPQKAGTLLAGLASNFPNHQPGFGYWSNRVLGPGRLEFGPSEPSAEAKSEALARELWDLSERWGRS